MIDLFALDSIARRERAIEPAYRRIPEPPLNASFLPSDIPAVGHRSLNGG
ncbi:hypothetical protein [Azospirillum sp. TSH100]|nr:hypothetical protein [Azospirillum sp. TSH100]